MTAEATLSRWELLLAGPANAAIPLTAPHAVVSSWLDDPPARQAIGAADSQSARSGHDDQTRKWACGPLHALQQPGHGRPLIALQVRLFDKGLATRLATAATAGAHVRLGTHDFDLIQPPDLIERVSWQDLRRWAGTRAWQVRFVTPASFRRGNRTSPWPAPETLARGLTGRWRRLHPDTAPALHAPAPGTVWVSDIDGRSQAHTLSRTLRQGDRPHQRDEVISGFTGRIRYVCDGGTDAEAATFDALMAFAAFAGVGSHTAYGFGVTQPEPTWQPPTSKYLRPRTRSS